MRCEVIGCGSGHAGPALVQAERRVGVGHQGGVRDDPQHPAVHADDEVVQPARVAAREQQRDRREEYEQPDQPAVEGIGLPGVPRGPGRGVGGAAGEHGDDGVLRDGQQPPLDQDQAAGEPLGVGDVQRRGVVRLLVQAERRVAVGAQGTVGVVADPPRPAQHPQVEAEQRAGVAAGEQDREERDDGDDSERDPQEEQHDVVRDRQQPLDQPQPAAQRLVQAGSHLHGIALVHGSLPCQCTPFPAAVTGHRARPGVALMVVTRPIQRWRTRPSSERPGFPGLPQDAVSDATSAIRNWQ